MNELDLHRLQTKEFIDRASVKITLRRAVEASDGAGGVVKTSPAPIDPQVGRVVGLRPSRTFTTPEGRQVILDKAIVGSWNFDVKVGDYFTHNEQDYEVMTIQKDPAWRTVAEVASRG